MGSAVGSWRLLALTVCGGGVAVAVLLGVLWFVVLTKPERIVASGGKEKYEKQLAKKAKAKEAKEAHAIRKASADEQERTAKMREWLRTKANSTTADDETEEEVRREFAEKAPKKKGKAKTLFTTLRHAYTHPLFSHWYGAVTGLVDVMTDVVFCLSLWRAAAIAGGVETTEWRLAVASTVCIGVSVLFCGGSVIYLYCSMASKQGAAPVDERASVSVKRKSGAFAAMRRKSTVFIDGAMFRPVFHAKQKQLDKTVFFLVIILSAAVNVRLAALLPWTEAQDASNKKNFRDIVGNKIMQLGAASKIVEDLPQMVLAAIYIVHTTGQSDGAVAAAAGDGGANDGGAAAAALVSIVVSGVSFFLTMLFLALQIKVRLTPAPHPASHCQPHPVLPTSTGLDEGLYSGPPRVDDEAEGAASAPPGGQLHREGQRQAAHGERRLGGVARLVGRGAPEAERGRGGTGCVDGGGDCARDLASGARRGWRDRRNLDDRTQGEPRHLIWEADTKGREGLSMFQIRSYALAVCARLEMKGWVFHGEQKALL